MVAIMGFNEGGGKVLSECRQCWVLVFDDVLRVPGGGAWGEVGRGGPSVGCVCLHTIWGVYIH